MPETRGEWRCGMTPGGGLIQTLVHQIHKGRETTDHNKSGLLEPAAGLSLLIQTPGLLCAPSLRELLAASPQAIGVQPYEFGPLMPILELPNHLYFTTPMPGWRQEQEEAYCFPRLLTGKEGSSSQWLEFSRPHLLQTECLYSQNAHVGDSPSMIFKGTQQDNRYESSLKTIKRELILKSYFKKNQMFFVGAQGDTAELEEGEGGVQQETSALEQKSTAKGEEMMKNYGGMIICNKMK
ncbi:uncharacterized protein LOC133751804 [Lepus europaeus]|uniref:uncharacterized protein LOC133751804 n=1 Tax=Lepus europaeus TaxID=9983 RepID=UPI002B464F82|nr:uncharacterized protein LOC133751804 [Lepus europaeus]